MNIWIGCMELEGRSATIPTQEQGKHTTATRGADGCGYSIHGTIQMSSIHPPPSIHALICLFGYPLPQQILGTHSEPGAPSLHSSSSLSSEGGTCLMTPRCAAGGMYSMCREFGKGWKYLWLGPGTRKGASSFFPWVWLFCPAGNPCPRPGSNGRLTLWFPGFKSLGST